MVDDSAVEAKKILTLEADRLLSEIFGEPAKNPPVNPLNSLIITILSQSTSDRNRDIAYRSLKNRFPGWEDAARASACDIAEAIHCGGLANQKAQRIKDILDWVKSAAGEYSLDWLADLPRDEAIDALTSLKGVGIKTAAVVLCFAFDEDIFPVDVHIHRICRRLGLVSSKASAEKTHHLMQPLIPSGRARSFHLNLLKLGRAFCRPTKPDCPGCPLLKICPFSR